VNLSLGELDWVNLDWANIINGSYFVPPQYIVTLQLKSSHPLI